MQGKRSVTLNDVAAEAGVSNATVSRFVNGKTFIAEDKARLIEDAIKKLGYKPNRIARNLKLSRAMQVMIVVPDIKNPYYAQMYATVQQLAYKKNYSVILFNTDEEAKNELDAIQLANELGCDGLIFCSTFDNDKIIHSLKGLTIPVVTSNTFGSMLFDTVHGIKSGQGVYIGTRHLIDYGHTRIGYAGGKIGSILNDRRLSGYKRAAEEAGLPARADYVFAKSFDVEGGFYAGEYFNSLSQPPTAIACANDMIAIGVMQYYTREGKSVPGDVSVVGMDNIQIAEFFKPALTTVTNDSREFARNAMELLFSRIEGIYDGPPREACCGRELIVRQSTARFNGK